MGRPIQEVKVFGVQDRRSTAQARLPWIVRRSIEGRQRSKSFRTRAEAERYRLLLLQAVHAGERFDDATGGRSDESHPGEGWLPGGEVGGSEGRVEAIAPDHDGGEPREVGVGG